MIKQQDLLWTWLLPDPQRELDRRQWVEHGGKWIVFDTKDRIHRIEEGLAPFIDAGPVATAKYWNGDPSAICVYSLDSERGKVLQILKKLGAGNKRVWEYDYAWGKNLSHPLTFLYSWSSKFITILRSYGIKGSFRLMQEILMDGRR